MKLVLAAVACAVHDPDLPAAVPTRGRRPRSSRTRVSWRGAWTGPRVGRRRCTSTSWISSGVVLESGQTRITVPNGTVTVGPPDRARCRDVSGTRRDAHRRGDARQRAQSDGGAEGREGSRADAEHVSAGGISEGRREAHCRERASRRVGLHVCSRPHRPASYPQPRRRRRARRSGRVRVQFRNGETRITKLVPGEALFFSGADAHTEEVSVGTPRVIAIELK